MIVSGSQSVVGIGSNTALEDAELGGTVGRHGVPLSDVAEQAWGRFQDRLALLRSGPRRRSLRLEPHREGSIPNKFQEWHIDVADRGVNARDHDLYRLCEVTGVDEIVQAVVACQVVTAECLTDAMQQVEAYQLHEFSFVCHCATDVSLACCLLLAALAYRQASVHIGSEAEPDDFFRPWLVQLRATCI